MAPVIDEAGTRALVAGATLAGVLEVWPAGPWLPAFQRRSHAPTKMVFALVIEPFGGGCLAQTGACGLIAPKILPRRRLRFRKRSLFLEDRPGAVGGAHHAA